jgi:recombination protein RecT
MTTSIIPVEEKGLTKITTYMDAPLVKARFAQIMGERGASNYISSVLIAVADSKSLQECNPASIYTGALRAATLRLSVDPGVGQAYLVPFGKNATLIVGYKGLHDMAVRTNRYRYINVSPIYEGQTVTEDQITGFHSLGGGRSGNKVIGWIGAFEMLARFGGYSKTLYMTVEEIHEHGKRYSKSYNRSDSPWQTEPAKMERKTILRLLLRRWGYIDPADVKELEEIESEQPVDAELSDITERTQGPKIKNSKDASISILSGNGNPDPVQDATWQEWLDWKARADKQGIDLSKVERNATTEGDLRMYLMEIAPGVADAEEQASITE